MSGSTVQREKGDVLLGRAKRCASVFSLPLRENRWRGRTGEYAGGGVGSSLDFQDHRIYAPGDDPRHINWNAYARTGHYSIKLYREEVQPVVDLFLDVSDSMFHPEAKAERTVELFYLLLSLAEKAGASTRIGMVRGHGWSPLEKGEVFSHRWREMVEILPAAGASEAPDWSRLPLRARSLRLLVSDLLYTSCPPEASLRQLTRQSGRAMIFCPWDAEEAAPDWEGNYDFRDSETRLGHDRLVDRRVLQRYKEQYRRHFEAWEQAGIRHRVPLARVRAGGTLEASLQRDCLRSGALILS